MLNPPNARAGGLAERKSSGGSYVGCVPFQPSASAALEFFGIDHNDELEEVDGRRVTPARAKSLIERFPVTLPHKIAVSGSRH